MNELKKTILGLWKPALKTFQEMTLIKLIHHLYFETWITDESVFAHYHSMPQAVLFIVFVIQYNFIENNIVNCRSNAKNKP